MYRCTYIHIPFFRGLSSCGWSNLRRQDLKVYTHIFVIVRYTYINIPSMRVFSYCGWSYLRCQDLKVHIHLCRILRCAYIYMSFAREFSNYGWRHLRRQDLKICIRLNIMPWCLREKDAPLIYGRLNRTIPLFGICGYTPR